MAGIGQVGSPGLGPLVLLAPTRTGAVAQNIPFTFDPRNTNQSAYVPFLGRGFSAIQVMSPINSAGPADLDVNAGGMQYFLAGGGNILNIPGPVWGLTITPRNAAVGGTGTDNITITPVGRLVL